MYKENFLCLTTLQWILEITEEFWLQKHEEWSASLSKIQNKILAYEKTKMNYIQSSEEFLKICSEIPELYKFANNEEKQKLINYVLHQIVFSNRFNA